MNLGRFCSISDSREFSRIYKNAKKWYCDCAVVYFLEGVEPKFAVVASKKIGKAVVRNLVKRRIRSSFYSLKDALKDGSYVIVARVGFASLPYEKICSSLKWAFKKVECLDETYF